MSAQIPMLQGRHFFRANHFSQKDSQIKKSNDAHGVWTNPPTVGGQEEPFFYNL